MRGVKVQISFWRKTKHITRRGWNEYRAGKRKERKTIRKEIILRMKENETEKKWQKAKISEKKNEAEKKKGKRKKTEKKNE